MVSWWHTCKWRLHHYLQKLSPLLKLEEFLSTLTSNTPPDSSVDDTTSTANLQIDETTTDQSAALDEQNADMHILSSSNQPLVHWITMLSNFSTLPFSHVSSPSSHDQTSDFSVTPARIPDVMNGPPILTPQIVIEHTACKSGGWRTNGTSIAGWEDGQTQ
jgi:hypothetical protein